MFRLLPLTILLAFFLYAGNGIPPLDSPTGYQAHEVTGDLAIGASYVRPEQARTLFGDDLFKRGYVVFEIAFYPQAGLQADISADDFRLRQGSDPSTVRAATPYMVAGDKQSKSNPPKIPSNVHVYNTETIGYETGGGRRGGVYTDSSVGVGIGRDPRGGPPQTPRSDAQLGLQQKLEDLALPETKTSKAIAGYVYFPKPSNQKKADFELMYLGKFGQATLKLRP